MGQMWPDCEFRPRFSRFGSLPPISRPLPEQAKIGYTVRMKKAALIATLLWFGATTHTFAPVRADTSACAEPICLVSREHLSLAHVITFDDVRSSIGVGHPIDDLLIRPGARFGERFVGQTLRSEGDYDRIIGAAASPLTAIPGAPGATLGAMRLGPTTVLQGHGPRAFPRVEAVGEGAIAIEFDTDQAALAFDLRGGEDGAIEVSFLRRDGSEITRLRIGPLAEESYAFVRQGNIPDIAGILITNSDPQGVSIDNLAFDKGQLTG